MKMEIKNDLGKVCKYVLCTSGLYFLEDGRIHLFVCTRVNFIWFLNLCPLGLANLSLPLELELPHKLAEYIL